MMREACGVFAVFDHPRAAQLTYRGLQLLQHRGQEAAGIITTTAGGWHAARGHGLVVDALSPQMVAALPGRHALGHVRYSTQDGGDAALIQPVCDDSGIALAHNGNVPDGLAIADSVALLQAIVSHHDRSWSDAILTGLRPIRGVYALAILTPDALFAVRDAFGVRPLLLGRIDGAFVLASESIAVTAQGGEVIRDIAAGEVVRIAADGVSHCGWLATPQPHFCAFEYVYFAHRDSQYNNNGYDNEYSMAAIRRAAGERLWHEQPVVDADVVVGVPRAGMDAATGYASAARLPLEPLLRCDPATARTFIAPPLRADNDRHRKFSVDTAAAQGKRIVLVDDSLVRGATLRVVAALLRQAGVASIAARIASPPFRFPCHYGIAVADQQQLAATNGGGVSADVDDLAYLSLAGLLDCLPRRGYCHACFSGEYPLVQMVPLQMLTA